MRPVITDGLRCPSVYVHKIKRRFSASPASEEAERPSRCLTGKHPNTVFGRVSTHVGTHAQRRAVFFSCWICPLFSLCRRSGAIQPSDRRNVRTDGRRSATVNGLPAPFGFASRVDHDGRPQAIRFRSAIGWMVQPPRANERNIS